MKKQISKIASLILLSVQTLWSQNPTWTNLGPITFPLTNGGQIHGIARCSELKFHPTDPNIMYAVSASGGLWKSLNKGVTWTSLGTDQVLNTSSASMAIDPKNDQIIYWGTGDNNYYSDQNGIYKTTNGGTTWFPVSNGIGNAMATEIIIDPTNSNNLIAATSQGIFKSTNAGANWNFKVSGSYQDMTYKAEANSKTIYACTATKFVRSLDNGDTWSEISNGLVLDGNGTRIAVSAASPNTVYVGVTKPYGTIFKSTNGGTSFVSQRTEMVKNLVDYGPDDTKGGQGNYNYDIVADPTNSNNLYLCSHIVWSSTDGGATWIQKQRSWADDLHTDQHHILFNPYNNSELWNANDGGIWKSINGGIGAWIPMSDGIAATEIYHGSGSNIDIQILGIGTQDNGSFYHSDNLWYNNGGGDFGAVHQSDFGSNSFYYPSDKNRRVIYGNITSDLNLPFAIVDDQNNARFAFTPANKSIAFVYDYVINAVYRTTNLLDANTVTWALLYTFQTKLRDLKVDTKNASVLYALTESGQQIYRFDNALNNATFSVLSSPSNSFDNALLAPMATENGIYLVSSNRTFKSTNKGANWTEFSSGLPSGNCLKIVADPYSPVNAIYYTTSLGVYYSDINTTTWLNYSQGLPVVANITDIDLYNDGINEGYLRVYYYGRGVWESILKQVAGAPYIKITAPATSSTFTTGASITLTAVAADVGGTISKVEFFNGSQSIGVVTTSPYNFIWKNVTSGTYTITAIATDNDSKTKTSQSIVIGVSSKVCSSTGSLKHEKWNNFTGEAIIKDVFRLQADENSSLTSFEAPSNVADNYQSRIRGYVCAPITGNYTFWIASDDHSELWLSTNDQENNKKLIAYVDGAVGKRAWENKPIQKSTSINLAAGTKYYIEAQLKEGGGDDHIAVGWQIPGGTLERPIPSSRLSPYISSSTTSSVAMFYSDCDFSGSVNSVDLPEGKYTIALLSTYGVKDDDLSSVLISNDLKIILYSDDNFTGDSVVLTTSEPCLVFKNFNDVVSSIIIKKKSVVTEIVHEDINKKVGITLFPNPVEASTTVKYEILNQSNVELSVLDQQGKQISTLFKGNNSAGVHELEIDLKSLNSGKYFLKFTSDKGVEIVPLLKVSKPKK